jgi:SAM-dependent methyltransferase
MALFSYSELKYYFFGLGVGLANVAHNGLRLGLKKTIGKISQPVNYYTRFPEYHYFGEAIQKFIDAAPLDRPIKILDIGSPKLLGIYFAAKTRADLLLTDISELNVDEYKVLWEGIKPKAKGSATFLLEDARALKMPDEDVDVVFSMSVVEHIWGEGGDSTAIEEMMRVLKPGGLLVLSVPFGPQFVAQQRVGLAEAVRDTKNEKAYFFQRVYNPEAFQTRIVDHARGLEKITFTTILRKNLWTHRAFAALGENGRAAVGFVNPVLSRLINRSREGMDASFQVDYGPLYSTRDVYGDLVFVGFKKNA